MFFFPHLFVFAWLFSFWFLEMKITLKFKKNVGTSEECFLISTHRHTFQFILYLYSVILLFVVPSVVHTGWQIMFHLFSHRLFCIGLFFLHLGSILNFLPITDFFNFTSCSKFKKKKQQQAKYNPFFRMFYLVFLFSLSFFSSFAGIFATVS